LFIESLENPAYQGVYNAVAPQPITNAQLNEAIAQTINRPMWLPNVPGFVLKLIFGEMANIILGGNFIKNQKLSSETSFQYKFSDIKVALKDLLG
jgi:NAD dependent epimerase/dehydratase family enzyme